ncbi:uncharacterized protein LOC121987958 [Zingiber officinale]|uniref:uncharacterized protein LOC121987958 n=1 Tax=Zingiber officinale TaxID=94328 RepID=UPI001C4CDB10|nr:uncharacterized protein LOC121987958 [Zingiber officinale]
MNRESASAVGASFCSPSFVFYRLLSVDPPPTSPTPAVRVLYFFVVVDSTVCRSATHQSAADQSWARRSVARRLQQPPTSQRNEEVSKVVNQNAPGNNQMISPAIQKDLTRACASEITLSIIEDIGNNVFSLMVDESRDISDAINALFVKHGLSLSRLRGQGYDGASNMRGEFNGLKSSFCKKIHMQDKVNTFCELNEIPVPYMKDNCLIGGRSRRRRQVITNLHYYCVEIFYQVVDSVIQEMNTRFSEVGIKLLSCITCLHPRNSFSEFNVQKLDSNFSGIEDLGSFAQKIVETLKNQAYPLVYRLIEMTLVLPVATASVEIVFSAMETIKTDLRNRMGDEWMNDSLVVYIEKDFFLTIENEQIL